MTASLPVPPALVGLGAVFDHVALASARIRDQLPLYADLLGGRFAGGWVNTHVGFRAATLAYPGGGQVELLEALDGSTFLDRFLARSGGRGGLHHVTFLVPDVDEAVAALTGAGHDVFGVSGPDPVWSDAFVHPRTTGGVLLQVAQTGPAYEAHFASIPALDDFLRAVPPDGTVG